MTKKGSATAKSGHRPPSRVWGVLLVLGIVLLAANLRPVLTGLTPLIGQIKADMGISYGGVGLLMALSLLAMGCSRPSRRCWPGGLECVLLVRMLVFAASILLRSVGPLTAMFLGTTVLGAGIAISNVLLPGLVKRELPERVGLMTSTYTAALAGSAAIAAGASFPVASQVDIGWRGSLALWALPALWPPWLPQVQYARCANASPAVTQGG